MKRTEKKRSKSLVFRFVMLALAVYAVVMLVEQQVSLSELRQKRETLQDEYEIQRIANKELERQRALGEDEEHIERLARGMDYVAPDEQVFIDISGS